MTNQISEGPTLSKQKQVLSAVIMQIDLYSRDSKNVKLKLSYTCACNVYTLVGIPYAIAHWHACFDMQGNRDLLDIL